MFFLIYLYNIGNNKVCIDTWLFFGMYPAQFTSFGLIRIEFDPVKSGSARLCCCGIAIYLFTLLFLNPFTFLILN